MAYAIPYHRHTFRPVNDQLAGNATADNPVEFDICPAWGADWARIKSIIYASLGLAQDGVWSPEVQHAVIAAFDSGAQAFVNTVEAIRGLMAVRAGILPDIPKGQSADTQVPVTTGVQFSRICGAVPVIALQVASEIAKLSQEAEAVDPRFFAQPSGSGGRGTKKKRRSTASSARSTSRRQGTAANPPAGADPNPGT